MPAPNATMPIEDGLVVMKWFGRLPTMAMCELCRLKFFVPDNLRTLADAKAHLREKFSEHECQPPLEGGSKS